MAADAADEAEGAVEVPGLPKTADEVDFGEVGVGQRGDDVVFFQRVGVRVAGLGGELAELAGVDAEVGRVDLLVDDEGGNVAMEGALAGEGQSTEIVQRPVLKEEQEASAAVTRRRRERGRGVRCQEWCGLRLQSWQPTP